MDSYSIDLDAPLASHPVTKAASIEWPIAVDARLDHLVELIAQRHRTNRRELLAALVLAATADKAELGEIIGDYREAVNRDALLHMPDASTDAKVVELPRHRPGPRGKRRTG